MISYKEHIVNQSEIARHALRILDQLSDSVSRTLFVVNNENQIVGSITDGDIRRGLLNDAEISQEIKAFMNINFKFLRHDHDNVDLIKEYRKADIMLIPIVDNEFKIVQIIDLRKTRTLLPITALIMAGGKGERLRPFTNDIPKPMLKVGEKPILEHNIDRLISFGVSDIFISVKYLKEQIIKYFGDGSEKGVRIHYIEENEPLGTLGALSLIDSIDHEDILVMNSDLLTNIDFEDFYNFYKSEGADMALASIPYVVNIPYAVLQTQNHSVSSFAEKPSYTYYSNGGIYLLKYTLKEYVTKGVFFNATDLMDRIIESKEKILVHYPLLGYWLDIGKQQDFIKAQEDIKHISFS
ncbi:NTP transferase domain-containing protein [Pedobacter panaciterrae]|jgi:dTDP-glucose pyrophosphorylase|uniref:nucleotidyltransferase family protein n=1 Tax=Pedobacter panaciterrae TaxID=363849 RepID=UPI00155D9E9E|nr:nucleotidyltransferase family protein [Pedobacter panaciterrae]NQX55253.1 NTP transferase domain-containing protein [Pedobacter panaciterrae]